VTDFDLTAHEAAELKWAAKKMGAGRKHYDAEPLLSRGCIDSRSLVEQLNRP